MTIAFRLTKPAYATDPLSGAGGLLADGRWHHRGNRIVYFGQTLSLCSIEYLVHFGRLVSQIDLIAIALNIPDALVEVLNPGALPADWSAQPSQNGTKDLGTAWLKSNRSAVLRVPSVVTVGEFNFLINPAHPDAGKLKVVSRTAFRYDERLIHPDLPPR